MSSNEMKFEKFQTILWLFNTKSMYLKIHKMVMSSFTGALIVLDSFFEYPLTTIIEKSVLILNSSENHFIFFSKACNITLKNSRVYVTTLNEKSFIISGSNIIKAHILIQNIEFTNMLPRDSQRYDVEAFSQFSLIHLADGFENLSIIRSRISLGRQRLKALIFITNFKILLIQNCKIIGSILNKDSNLFIIDYRNYSSLKIMSTIISFNRVVKGGFLKVIIVPTHIKTNDYSRSLFIYLSNSSISHNRATNAGGLIYFEVLESQNSKKTIQKIKNLLVGNFLLSANSYLVKNTAVQGNIFYIDSVLPLEDSLLKMILNLKIKFSGIQHPVGYPIREVGIPDLPKNKGKNISYAINSKVVNNKTIGPPFYFSLALYDKYNELVVAKNENDLNASINSKKLIPSLLITQLGYSLFLNFTFQKSIFSCYKITILGADYISMMGRRFSFGLNLNSFKKFLPSIKENLSTIEINYYVEECEPGEDFNGQICEPCSRNSFYDSKIYDSLSVCTVCNDSNNFYCYGASYRSPKKNYWRLSHYSKQFLRCPMLNCLGDEYFIKNYTERDNTDLYFPGTEKNDLLYFYDKNFTAIGNCKYGYKGNLCSECIPGFGFSARNKCSDCSYIEPYLKQTIFMIVKIILFFYSNWISTQNKLSQNQEIKSPSFIENIKSSYLLKILFIYFNLLSLLKSLPFEFELITEEIFSIGSNISPTEDFEFFSFECLLKRLNISMPPIYAHIILNILFFFFSFTILLCVLFRHKKKINSMNLMKFVNEYLKGLFLLFFMNNIILFSSPFIKIMFCINIGDSLYEKNVLLSNLSLDCSNKLQRIFRDFLAAPVLGLFLVVIPLIISVNLLKAKLKGRLDDKKFIMNYGYFIFPYKNRVIFYEIISLSNKLFIVVFKELFLFSIVRNNQNFILVIFLIYLIFYNCVQTILSPYEPNGYSILQNVDTNSIKVSISNCLIALIWSLIEFDENILLIRTCLILYLIISNFIFLLYWLHSYFQFLKVRVTRITNIFQKIKLRIIKKIYSKSSKNSKISIASEFNKAQQPEEFTDSAQNENLKMKLLISLLINHIKAISEKEVNKTEEGEVKGLLINDTRSYHFSNITKCNAKAAQENSILNNLKYQIEEKNSKPSRDEEEISSLEIKILSKKVQGSNFFDHFLLLKCFYEVDDKKNALPENLLLDCEVLTDGWVACIAKKKAQNILYLGIRKLKNWSEEASQIMLIINFKSFRRCSTLKKEIKYSDFIKLDHVEWLETYPRNLINSFQINKPLYINFINANHKILSQFERTTMSKIYGTIFFKVLKANKKLKKIAIIKLRVVISAFNQHVFIIELENTGNFKIFGEKNERLKDNWLEISNFIFKSITHNK